MLDPATQDPRLVANSSESPNSPPDWAIDQNPQAHSQHHFSSTNSPINPLSSVHLNPGFSQAPIILRYSVHSLATLKPPRISDLIDEAAVEFNLDPKSILLAVRIQQNYIKISPTLYQRIAPLSTIHVKLSTYLPKSLPKHLETIPSPSTTPSTITDVIAKTTPATNATTNSPIIISNSPSSYDLQNNIQFTPTVTPHPAVNLSQPSANLSLLQEAPVTSTPSTITSVLPSPLQINESETFPSRKTIAADSAPLLSLTSTSSSSSSSSSVSKKDGIPQSRNPAKKFLIHSLAHSQPRSHQQDPQDPQSQHPQRRPCKFPFLLHQRSNAASASTSSSSPISNSSTSANKATTTKLSSSQSSVDSPAVFNNEHNGLNVQSPHGQDNLPYVDLVNDIFKDFQQNSCSTVESNSNHSKSKN